MGAPSDEELNELVCRKYVKDKKVGEGTYAVVYKTFIRTRVWQKAPTEITTERRVAIKKIKVGQFKDGLDMSAVREVKFLQELKHPNIIELIDVYSHRTNLNLVLEYLDSDLEMIIKDKSIVFMPSDIKSWLMMTLRGLHHLHSSWILHRDMKPNNLLLSSSGLLKLADFGLAREYGDALRNMTCQVVTRWYRPPELLFGAREYGPAIDMWATGAIFAELMLRTPYLPGESDMEQLNIIFRALGTPSAEDWPGMTLLPDYVAFKVYPRTPLRSLFTAAGSDALDLLEKMLIHDPRRRISAMDALKHPYFSNRPRPTEPSKLPKQEPARLHEGDRRSDLKRKGLDDEESEPNSKRIARRLF